MTHTLTAYQQEQLNRLTAAGCIANTQINPITRKTFHKLRELKLVDFRAGWDDFEWFVVPQETETQEAPAAVATCDFCEERPRMAQGQYCETCARQIVGYFTEAHVTHWMNDIKQSSGILIPPAPEQIVDIFNGLADFDPRPRAVERIPVHMPKLDVAPTAFKQVKGGILLSTSKVFSRKSQWNGKGWIVGRWNELLALALMPDGTLLLLDAGLACEVRPRKTETLDALFTAWAGVDWNAKLKARV